MFCFFVFFLCVVFLCCDCLCCVLSEGLREDVSCVCFVFPLLLGEQRSFQFCFVLFVLLADEVMWLYVFNIVL